VVAIGATGLLALGGVLVSRSGATLDAKAIGTEALSASGAKEPLAGRRTLHGETLGFKDEMAAESPAEAGAQEPAQQPAQEPAQEAAQKPANDIVARTHPGRPPGNVPAANPAGAQPPSR
jgi:hypothetical protein